VSKVTQNKRKAFAKKHLAQRLTRWVVMDMKWFYEVGGGVHEAEQDLKGSPLKPEMLLRRKTGETKTQGLKVMFMACVSESKPIGLWEMKKKDWFKSRLKDGGPAKGIGAAYFNPFIKKIKKAAVKALGPGPIGIWLDNAKVHTSAYAGAELDKHFDEVVFQSPSSPEMSIIDAGIFPGIQVKADEKNATTTAQIRAAVHASRQSTSSAWPPVCAGT